VRGLNAAPPQHVLVAAVEAQRLHGAQRHPGVVARVLLVATTTRLPQARASTSTSLFVLFTEVAKSADGPIHTLPMHMNPAIAQASLKCSLQAPAKFWARGSASFTPIRTCFKGRGNRGN
jgi:hypothetical protein